MFFLEVMATLATPLFERELRQEKAPEARVP